VRPIPYGRNLDLLDRNYATNSGSNDSGGGSGVGGGSGSGANSD
jgi:hypothetical protein